MSEQLFAAWLNLCVDAHSCGEIRNGLSPIGRSSSGSLLLYLLVQMFTVQMPNQMSLNSKGSPLSLRGYLGNTWQLIINLSELA